MDDRKQRLETSTTELETINKHTDKYAKRIQSMYKFSWCHCVLTRIILGDVKDWIVLLIQLFLTVWWLYVAELDDQLEVLNDEQKQFQCKLEEEKASEKDIQDQISSDSKVSKSEKFKIF